MPEDRSMYTAEWNELARIYSFHVSKRPFKGKNGQILKRNRRLMELLREVEDESRRLMDLAREEGRVYRPGMGPVK